MMMMNVLCRCDDGYVYCTYLSRIPHGESVCMYPVGDNCETMVDFSSFPSMLKSKCNSIQSIV